MTAPLSAGLVRSSRRRLARCLLAGLAAGTAAAVMAVPLAWLLQRAAGASYEELAVAHLAQACVVSGLLGGAAYWALGGRARRPARVFAALVLAFALAYSLYVAVVPPAPSFALVVTPLHLLVAATVALLVPRLGGAP